MKTEPPVNDIEAVLALVPGLGNYYLEDELAKVDPFFIKLLVERLAHLDKENATLNRQVDRLQNNYFLLLEEVEEYEQEK